MVDSEIENETKNKTKKIECRHFFQSIVHFICFRVYYVYILAMKERNRIKKRKFNHPFTVNFYHITMQLIYTNTILKKC